ncbi:hypothetical protein ACU4GD_24230 [Cupriavidus basilensis]
MAYLHALGIAMRALDDSVHRPRRNLRAGLILSRRCRTSLKLDRSRCCGRPRHRAPARCRLEGRARSAGPVEGNGWRGNRRRRQGRRRTGGAARPGRALRLARGAITSDTARSRSPLPQEVEGSRPARRWCPGKIAVFPQAVALCESRRVGGASCCGPLPP